MPKVVSIRVPGEPSFINVLRMTVGSTASIAGFDVEAVDDIAVSVGDAAKLVTCHGNDKWCEYYDVSISCYEEKIEVEVKADAAGHTICKSQNRPCLDCPNEGDLASSIIKSLMDSVEIVEEDGCKSIKMVKNI
ncbi:MAG: ATP-binding protein [Anaerovoracaceae bacterium]